MPNANTSLFCQITNFVNKSIGLHGEILFIQNVLQFIIVKKITEEILFYSSTTRQEKKRRIPVQLHKGLKLYDVLQPEKQTKEHI